MYMKIFVILSLALATLGKPRDIEDNIALGLIQIEIAQNETLEYFDGKVHDANNTLLYIEYSKVTLSDDGHSYADKHLADVNENAVNYTALAIIEGKPDKVLECISNRNKTSFDKVDILVVDLDTELDKQESSGLADATTAFDGLIAFRPNIFTTFSGDVEKINACTDVSCVDKAVSGAHNHQSSLQNDIDDEANKVQKVRNSYNKDTFALISSLQIDVDDETNDAIHDIKKC